MKLIKIIANTFTGGELSNEDYHSDEGISGTGLSEIYKSSVLEWKETTRKPSDVLGFGIASHACFLEPELFKKEFYQGFDESKYPNAMRTQVHLKDFLSKHGLKQSGSKKDMIDRVLDHCNHIGKNAQIIDVMRKEWDLKNKGKTEVDCKDWDQLAKMRDRLMLDGEVLSLLSGGFVERSIIALVDFFDELADHGEDNNGQYIVRVKIRPDIVGKSFALVDYKTCTDCFGKFTDEVFKFNYDLKMALQHDILSLVFSGKTGKNPTVTLLAQNKLMPSQLSNAHEYCPWILDEEILSNGRVKYLEAILKWCDYKTTGIAKGIGNEARFLSMEKWHKV